MRGLSGWARMRAAWALEDRERDAAAAAGAVAAAGGKQLAVEGQGGGEGKGALQNVGAWARGEAFVGEVVPLEVVGDEEAMALAAAEAGHIRLHGDKPTTAKAVLARVRRKPLADERLAKEEELRERLRDLAWLHDTPFGVPTFSCAPPSRVSSPLVAPPIHAPTRLTQREYNVMCGRDVRLHKDPLAIRMDKKQCKRVWGGDPMYPTVNYEQAPSHGVDNRGLNFNEPSEDPLSVLGKVVTQEQMEAIMTREQEEEAVSHTS
ncbi:unnamed protein product [Closterium sp. NIES-65]|nr:unnamed protein product [Closterium sp. NIES-65]